METLIYMRQHFSKNTLPLLTLLALTSCTLSISSGLFIPAQAQLPDYAYYYNQGNSLYERGELTKAIEMYEKALPLAKGPSVPIAFNNLATIYMRRGNYVLTQLKQPENALNDFRKAYFLMDTGWPEGMEKSERQWSNTDIAESNLDIGYQNLRIKANDTKAHLDMAKKLRYQGQFQEAIVEYNQVLKQNAKDPNALRAMGDLFNVLSRPEKSKKYYALAVNNNADSVDDEVLVRLANAQNKAGEVDNAVKNLNKALEKNPNNVAALKQLEDIWSREVRFNPQSVLGHANLASVMQKKKQYPEALRAYNHAEALAARDPKATLETKKLIRLNLGTLYQQMGDAEMAHKAYDTVLQLDPANQLAVYYKATLYRDSGQSENAINQYNKLLTLNPSYDDAHEDLLALIQRRPTLEAIQAGLTQYGNDHRTNPIAQTKVGEAFHSQKNYDAAIVHYKRAVAIKPDLMSAYINLGAALEASGKTNEAISNYQQALAIDPGNDQVKQLLENANQNVGILAYQEAVKKQQNGDIEGALVAYQQAVQNPQLDTAELRANYGIALQSANRLDEAVKQYEQALAKEPTNGNYFFYKATVLQQQDKLSEASAAYQRALRMKTLDAEVKPQAEQALAAINEAEAADLLNKVVDAYTRKSYPQALTLIQQALVKDPNNATTYYYQGLVFTEQNKLVQSVTSLRKALSISPDFKDAQFSLAVALDKKSDTAGAKAAYQQFIQMAGSDSDDYVIYARERIASL